MKQLRLHRKRKRKLVLRKKKWIPHNYQKRCVKKGLKEQFLAFFLDPGLGKTSIILEIFRILLKAKLVKGMLVVSPLRPAYMTWPKEITEWANFNHLSYTILHDEYGNKDKEINKKYDIYIINPEGLRWLIRKGLYRKRLPFDMLVVDESTKFKNVSAKRFTFIRKIVRRVKRRYILTGTPIPRTLENILGQFYIVDQGEAFGSKKGHFRSDYFKQIGRPEWQQFEPRPEKVDRIYRKVAKRSIQLNARDYLELPERKNLWVEVRLPKKARQHYLEMENEYATIVDQEGVEALTASSAYQKCHQIANGCIYKQDSSIIQPGVKVRGIREFHIIHEEKLDALEDLIEELQGKPLLIGYYFNHDLHQLKKRFKKLRVMSNSMKECIEIEEKWNKGMIHLLAAHPASSSLGLNLQKGPGHDIAFYSLTHDFEAYEQYIMRLERQGSKANHIRVHHFLAENTVEQAIRMNIELKDGNQQTFKKMVRKYIKNR